LKDNDKSGGLPNQNQILTMASNQGYDEQYTDQQYSNQQYSNQQYSSQPSNVPQQPLYPQPEQAYQQYGQQMPFPGGFQEVATSFTSAVNNPLVSSMANSKLAEVQDYMMPGASGVWNLLRYYFHVDNKYVLKKAQLLIFPWRHVDWGRIQIGDTNAPSFAPPVGDINAPDLYLPVMLFLSYILCIGGLRGQGNPQILEKTFSTCTLTLFVELCLMKGGLYTMTMKNPIATADLLIYSSYKYIGLGLTLLIGIACGRAGISYVYSTLLVYAALCQGFFVYQTLNKVILKPTHGTEAGHKRRLYLIGACSALQIITFLFLGYLDDISVVSSNL